MDMDVNYDSCAGLDVHQETVIACILHGKRTSTRPKAEIRTFGTTQSQLDQLADWLKSFDCQAVALESTGVFWKPIWHVLADKFKLILANPQRIKGIPGHKTDKKDARWIAKLLRLDLIPASFVPDEEIQDLRDLTRTRKYLIESRNKQKNRIHQILQCGGIKLTTYIEDIFGKSGRNMLELLVNGEIITPQIIKPLVYTSLKKKVPQIVDAMNGFMRSHHRFMLREMLDIINAYEKSIAHYEAEIDTILQQYEAEVQLLISFKGLQRDSAGIIIAEIGVDMSVFDDEKHLASWAGLCPGNHESAGKRYSSKINHGNAYLKRILCQASWAAAKSPTSELGAFFRRKKKQRGPKKAAVATAHRLLKQIYFTFLEYSNQKERVIAATITR